MGVVSMLAVMSCVPKDLDGILKEAQTIVAAESLTLNPSYASVEAGDLVTIKATVKPEDATFKTVSWKSSDLALAEVYNGTVKTLKEGSVTITASVGSLSATCNIVITKAPIPVESITLNKTATTIEIGKTETLTATVNPEDADDPTVTWTSSNFSPTPSPTRLRLARSYSVLHQSSRNWWRILLMPKPITYMSQWLMPAGHPYRLSTTA